MVTLSPPTSEAGVWPQVGTLIVACGWSTVYGTLTNCMYWFPLPFELPVVYSVESNVKTPNKSINGGQIPTGTKLLSLLKAKEQ